LKTAVGVSLPGVRIPPHPFFLSPTIAWRRFLRPRRGPPHLANPRRFFQGTEDTAVPCISLNLGNPRGFLQGTEDEAVLFGSKFYFHLHPSRTFRPSALQPVRFENCTSAFPETETAWPATASMESTRSQGAQVFAPTIQCRSHSTHVPRSIADHPCPPMPGLQSFDTTSRHPPFVATTNQEPLSLSSVVTYSRTSKLLSDTRKLGKNCSTLQAKSLNPPNSVHREHLPHVAPNGRQKSIFRGTEFLASLCFTIRAFSNIVTFPWQPFSASLRVLRGLFFASQPGSPINQFAIFSSFANWNSSLLCAMSFAISQHCHLATLGILENARIPRGILQGCQECQECHVFFTLTRILVRPIVPTSDLRIPPPAPRRPSRPLWPSSKPANSPRISPRRPRCSRCPSFFH
jgi:hypothetical protein